jgi:hypothetical protein
MSRLRPTGEPAYRGVESRTIASTIAGTELSRSMPLLGWTGIAGAHYRVRILTADLQLLAESTELSVPEYAIDQRRRSFSSSHHGHGRSDPRRGDRGSHRGETGGRHVEPATTNRGRRHVLGVGLQQRTAGGSGRRPAADIAALVDPHRPLPVGSRVLQIHARCANAGLVARGSSRVRARTALEAVSDATLRQLTDPEDANHDGVSGTLQQVRDPASGREAVGRFAPRPPCHRQRSATAAARWTRALGRGSDSLARRRGGGRAGPISAPVALSARGGHDVSRYVVGRKTKALPCGRGER